MEFPSKKFRHNAESSTGLVFIRAYNRWHSTIRDALKKTGITHPQFVVMTVLNYLSQFEPFVTQASIAKMADMDVMSVSQIVRGLEAKGFLARSENPQDSRANAVALLPKGQETVRYALPVVEKIDKEFFNILGKEEARFRAMLTALLESSNA